MDIRIVVADDHVVVVEGLRALFSGGQIEIVAAVADGESAIVAVRDTQPNVLLLDVRLNQSDGLQTLIETKAEFPSLPVVMFSAFENPTYAARAIAYGASNFLSKNIKTQEFEDAIYDAATGKQPPLDSWFSRLKNSLHEGPNVDQKFGIKITRRESQVLQHIAYGLSNKEIGWSLGISVETVKEHVQNVLRKINHTDRTAAAVWAIRNQLVH